jgi:hypothetical protein
MCIYASINQQHASNTAFWLRCFTCWPMLARISGGSGTEMMQKLVRKQQHFWKREFSLFARQQPGFNGINGLFRINDLYRINRIDYGALWSNSYLGQLLNKLAADAFFCCFSLSKCGLMPDFVSLDPG